MKRKIIQLKDKLEVSDFAYIDFDVLIYFYENYGYEGSGYAVWRNKGKWSYSYLGHCSCNGPTENLKQDDKVKFTLKQIKEICTKNKETGQVEIENYLTSKKYK